MDFVEISVIAIFFFIDCKTKKENYENVYEAVCTFTYIPLFVYNVVYKININRQDAVNIVIASIAIEKLAFAYILNAKCEKLPYVFGDFEGSELGK